MCKTTRTTATRQTESAIVADTLLVLANVLLQELDALHDAHGEGCSCVLCHSVHGPRYFTEVFIGLFGAWRPGLQEDWPSVAAIRSMLSRHLGDDAGQPIERWTIPSRHTPAHTDRDPAAARKAFVLCTVLTELAERYVEIHDCGEGCEPCHDANGYLYALGWLHDTLDGELIDHDGPDAKRATQELWAILDAGVRPGAAELAAITQHAVHRYASA